MTDNKEFDPKLLAQMRKEELEGMMGTLEQGVKDIFNSDKYKDYLNFCAKLPRYSVNNQILIMLQRPDATMCQSFSGWKDMNRFVKKGEKGIRIMAPAPFKKEVEQDKFDENGHPVFDANGDPVKETKEITVNAFKPVSTFDISQTEGEPIPVFCAEELTSSVEGYDQIFEALKNTIPVPISFEDIKGEAKGFYHIEDNRIAIKEGMSQAQTVKTIIHEAAHAALHSKDAMSRSEDKKTRNQKETEAESVAYIVCKHFGIDTADYSFGYLATWSGDKDVPELKNSLETIRRTASDMIIKLEDKLKETEVIKDVDKFMEAHEEELPFDDPEPSEKPSVLKQLKEEKAKSEKTKSKKRTPDKNMEAVI